jgi:hypothetical protein
MPVFEAVGDGAALSSVPIECLPLAKEASEQIAQLYAIEQDISGRSPAERVTKRQMKSRPMLRVDATWLKPP